MQRIPELDGVRAVAVLLVMLFHIAYPAMPGGWVGVDIFFVLSGFLITSILLNEHEATRRIDLKAFYIRRARRLLPAVTFLLLCYGTFLIAIGQSIRKAAVAFAATHLYAVNWLMAFDAPVDFGPFYHFWSLSIEEQFYLLWPLSLIGLLAVRRVRRRIPILLMTAAGLISAWRIVLYLSGATADRILYGFDTRADA
jgi:peptidoglycan/LPS O-acetylase OafA/YrhL